MSAARQVTIMLAEHKQMHKKIGGAKTEAPAWDGQQF